MTYNISPLFHVVLKSTTLCGSLGCEFPWLNGDLNQHLPDPLLAQPLHCRSCLFFDDVAVKFKVLFLNAAALGKTGGNWLLDRCTSSSAITEMTRTRFQI